MSGGGNQPSVVFKDSSDNLNVQQNLETTLRRQQGVRERVCMIFNKGPG